MNKIPPLLFSLDTKQQSVRKPIKTFANPIELLFFIIALIFLSEAIIMIFMQIFPILPRLSKIQGALLDALLLSALTFPFLYLFIVKPMSLHISELKRAEKELQHLTDELRRSNTDLQQFAYVASHDLQAPLRVIEGFANLLAKRYKEKLDAKANEFIECIVDEVKRMQILIRDLLEYSQAETKDKEFKSVDMSYIVQRAISNLRTVIEESGAVVTFDDLPTVMADDIQLISLLQNLIDNAIKYRGKEAPKVHVSAEKKGDDLVFSVRDNGIGMDPKNAEAIFETFYRLHGNEEYPGIGVGLAICKKIVERHEGRIWVRSEFGKGSTFYFTIPNKNYYMKHFRSRSWFTESVARKRKQRVSV